MSLRLLGKCPSCEALDEIVEPPYEKGRITWKVKCGSCCDELGDYSELVRREEKKGNRLIPVSIFRYRNSGIEVTWPQKREIPHSRLIATVLNCSLIAKFNLRVCLATEGGVEGGGFSLLNNYDSLGLHREYGEQNAGEALDLYEKMLKQLFEKPLKFGNVNFRRGEILWLEEKEETISDALIYLFGTLTCVENRKFAESVLKTKEDVEANPFSGAHIGGAK